MKHLTSPSPHPFPPTGERVPEERVRGEGFSAGPWKGKLRPYQTKVGAQNVAIITLSDYFHAIETARVSVNIVSYVGIGNVWQAVMGESFDRPGQEQLEQMKSLLAEAM